MDDFIHNLRTGKNKPFDRNRKQFDNSAYKNPERQTSGDNRRKDSFQRTHQPDNFPAIKKLLEDITDSQRRLIEINEQRAKAEERIAAAIEIISSGFLRKKEAGKSSLTIEEPIKAVEVEPVKPVAVEPVKPVAVEPVKPVEVEPVKPVAVEPVKPVAVEPVKPVAVEPVKPVAVEPVKPVAVTAKDAAEFEKTTKSVLSREKILEMIEDMRKEQFSFEKIARSLKMQGISTFSGKGEWHSQTISKLCQQMGSSGKMNNPEPLFISLPPVS